MDTSMTALVSAFARAWHSAQRGTKIFDDTVARRLLTEEEFRRISENMAQGIRFFDPAFAGTPEEALCRIVERQLAPQPLARAAFAEKALGNAVRLGAAQVVLLGAGYDTFAYRQPDWARNIRIFELDRPDVLRDKQLRLARAGIAVPDNVSYTGADLAEGGWPSALTQTQPFDPRRRSFCTALGLVCYLERKTFAALLAALARLMPEGSTLVFDYPDGVSHTAQAGERAKRQAALATAAGEPMRPGYAYPELEALLAEHGFLIYEHLSPEEMTAQVFAPYNRENPTHAMTAFDNVAYCLAVRRRI